MSWDFQIECERVSSGVSGRRLELFVPPTQEDIHGIIATGPIAELKQKWKEDGVHCSVYLVNAVNVRGEQVGLHSFMLSCGMLFERFIKDVDDGDENVLNGGVDSAVSSMGDELPIFKVGALDVSSNEIKSSEPNSHGYKDEHEMPASNRITRAYPAVKLEYWAKNYSEEAKRVAEMYEKSNKEKLGKVVFVREIVKKILDGVDLLYAQYCYVFSADNSDKDKRLTKYYESLGFSDLKNLNVLCSDDDRGCPCLAIKVDDLREMARRTVQENGDCSS